MFIFVLQTGYEEGISSSGVKSELLSCPAEDRSKVLGII